MMKQRRVFLILLVAGFSLGVAGLVPADQGKRPKRAPAGPLVTIHAPHPQQWELALDEVELDWSKTPGAKERTPAKSAVPVPGTKIEKGESVRAVASVIGAASPDALRKRAKSLKDANPGAESHLVLYEPGLPRGKASRRLLTRHVGLILDKAVDPQSVLSGLPGGQIKKVPGVPDGYTVEAEDPLAALGLADALRLRPGVQSAYPLLQRQHFTR
jgi:hypothetical protein